MSGHSLGINYEKKRTGNTKDYALRRLRKNRPDLYQQVLLGEKSSHCAMIEAGFRKKTLSVPTDLQQAASTLCRHFSLEEVDFLAQAMRDFLGQTVGTEGVVQNS